MKKIIYLAALLITAIGITTSCKDDEPEFTQQPTNAKKLAVKASGPQAEYTICVYGCSGGNLDPFIISEFLENSDCVIKTKGKVRVVGLYKAAKDMQAELGENGGTRYFEIKLKDGVDSAKVSKDDNNIYAQKDSIQMRRVALKAFTEDMVNEKYAESNFNMYEPANMAAAFKFLTEMAPAKKYILLTNNHGGGWDFIDDKPMHTRAMVFDDNCGDKGISLDQLNEGVKQSGVKFDVLFCDLCLMGTLENLYGYSGTFPICIASAETTTSSYFGQLATRLAQLGGDATHDQLFNQCSEWTTTTDILTGYRIWETMDSVKSIKAQFQDMGCYDLTKIGNITAPLRNISNWFNKAMADSNTKYIVEKSVLTTLYTTMPNANNSTLSFYRNYAIDELRNVYGQNMTCDSLADRIIGNKDGDMYKTLTNSKNKKVQNYYNLQSRMTYGYPMAYFLWNTIRIAKQYKDTRTASELQALLDNYETALKSMCRIKCSCDDFKGYTYDGVAYPAMDPYLWTSPAVTITSLNSNGFQNTAMIGYSPWANRNIELGQAISSYNSTKFDQTTNWSKFLQQLDVNPNIVTNISRNIPVYYSKFDK